MISNNKLNYYQEAFLLSEDVEGKKEYIEGILKVELQSYCNELSGSTTGCYAFEELYNNRFQTMSVLKLRIEDYYLEYLNHIKQNDMDVLKEVSLLFWSQNLISFRVKK